MVGMTRVEVINNSGKLQYVNQSGELTEDVLMARPFYNEHAAKTFITKRQNDIIFKGAAMQAIEWGE